MIAYKIIRIFIILVMLSSLSVFVFSHHTIGLNKLTNEEGHPNKYFAKILKSIVKLNEERIGSLKKLYILNNYRFGKEPLRSYINNAEDYDELLKSIKVILKELNDKENSVPNYYPSNLYRTHNLNVRQRREQYIDRVLRQITENSKSDISDNRQKSDEDSQNVSVTSGDEKNISELSSEVSVKGKNESLRYYYYYMCDDSEARCRQACKSAYRRVCDDSRCPDRLRSEMRKTCKKACSKLFDD